MKEGKRNEKNSYTLCYSTNDAFYAKKYNIS